MKVFVAFVAGCILLHFSWSTALHVVAFILLLRLLSVRSHLVAMAAGEVSLRLAALLDVPGRTFGRWG